MPNVGSGSICLNKHSPLAPRAEVISRSDDYTKLTRYPDVRQLVNTRQRYYRRQTILLLRGLARKYKPLAIITNKHEVLGSGTKMLYMFSHS